MEPVGFISPQCRRARVRQNKPRKRQITTMSENQTEKRAARRHKVLKGATIAFGGSGVACTVRNLSSHGAALDLASGTVLPASFMLVIEADQFIRRCHSVWSREKRIGVAFD
jgi:hypothetical protein